MVVQPSNREIRLSVAIMHTPIPERKKMLENLLEALGAEYRQYIKIHAEIKEKDEGIWRIAKKAWNMVSEGATHHLVLQDDVMPCKDFFLGAIQAIKHRPNHPIGFYANRKICEEAYERGRSWVVIPDGAWGPAMCLPIGIIPEWLKWCERNIQPEFKPYDSRLCMYLLAIGNPVWCTVPSLIEHIAPSNSVIGHGSSLRVARRFLGFDKSALSINWSIGINNPIFGINTITKGYYKYMIKDKERKGIKTMKDETDVKENITPEETEARVISRRALKRGQKEIEKKNKHLEKVQIEYMKIEELKGNEYNPNRQNEHDFELLLRSMEEDGFTQPIVINIDNTIVDGEHRWRAARVLGMKEVPCIRVDMGKEQARISTLRHNRARGSEDIELSTQVLRDLQSMGALEWLKDSLIMDDDEINKLIADIPAPEALAGKEFSEGWIPEKGLGGEMAGAFAEGITEMDYKDIRLVSTQETSDAIRIMEQKIREARTIEDKESILKDNEIKRVNFIFCDVEEKRLAMKYLSRRAADILLYLLKEIEAGRIILPEAVWKEKISK